MNAPFYKFGYFGGEVSLIVAFVTGIAFGIFLERAGFGNARLLAAQFYFRDLRVLKVMFTAIVTAMTGLFLVARLGWVDLSLVYLTPTFVVPQIVGGLILGAGFIIGGYCPGTSCVSAATGRIDGMVYLAGMVGGLLGFAEIFPRIAGFATSTPLGQMTIPQMIHVPYGVVVFAVVLMALAAFVAAEWAEKTFGGKEPDPDGLLRPSRRLAPVRRLALVLVAAGFVAAVTGNPYRGAFAEVDTKQLALEIEAKANRVGAEELASRLVAGSNELLIVDVRDAAAFAQYHVPGAIHAPLSALNRDFAAPNERILCYSDGDADGAQAAFLLRALGYRSAYSMTGGLEAWKANVLFPTGVGLQGTETEKREFARRAAVAKYFGGSVPDTAATSSPAGLKLPLLTPPPADSARQPLSGTKKKKKEGC